MNQEVQPQEQTRALMVQAMWLSTVVSVIVGVAMVANVLLKVIESVSEVREAEKK